MRFYNSKKTGMSNSFLFGVTAGVVVGTFFANRWMNKGLNPNQNEDFSQQTTNPHTTQTNSGLDETISHMNDDSKKDLFETFLNGDNQDLTKKVTDLN